jgi:hypothetical protein
MRTALIALALSGLALSASAADDVILTEKKADVAHCKALGEVKAKSRWGGSAGCDIGMPKVREALAKSAKDLGGNYVLVTDLSCGFSGTTGKGQAYVCSEESMAKQDAEQAALDAEASKEIRCETGTDCEMKWSRVTQWLLDHSDWKLRNVTDTLITTEGPFDTAKPSYEVVKMPTGDGKTYLIRMRAACGEGHDCAELIRTKKISFGTFVRGEAAGKTQ